MSPKACIIIVSNQRNPRKFQEKCSGAKGLTEIPQVQGSNNQLRD
jgi:hypothetical protein